MDLKRYPTKVDADASKKPAKKIDNALLEKMMRNRNGSNP